MTGFIRGLLGLPKKEEAPAPAPAPKAKTEAKEFFLDFETAQTFGDIERMRKEVEVHKSFPKGTTPVEQPRKQKSAPIQDTTPSTSGSTTGETLERRKSDRNLDAFRNMAKDMKKHG